MRNVWIAPLLVVAAIVAAGCNKTTSENVPTAATAPDSGNTKSWDYAAELKKLLPADKVIAGWKLDGEQAVVEASKLAKSGWDRTGEFAPYGLKYQMTASYTPTSPGKPPFKLEVFFLDSSISSFGVFARQRTPESHFVTAGNQAIEEGKQVRFWKGPLYAEITASGDIEPPKDFLVSVAKDVASAMVMTRRLPDLLTVLPLKGLVPNSQKYGPFDGFGASGSKMAVSAEYSISGVTFRAAVAQMATTDAAKAVIQALKKSLDASGQRQDLTATYGEESFGASILADRLTFYVRHASFLGQVENVPNESFAESVLKEMTDRMVATLDQIDLSQPGNTPPPTPSGGSGKDAKSH